MLRLPLIMRQAATRHGMSGADQKGVMLLWF